MVFKVRANFANDFTCTLPIASSLYSKWGMYNLDCYIDWGDGTIEYLNNDNIDEKVNEASQCIEHKYNNLTEPENFEVRISGLLECLHRTGVTSDAYRAYSSIDNSIIQILQWGNVGLQSMRLAFAGNTMLESLPKDELGALKNITDFTDAFNSCKNLKTIPEGFFENCSEAKSFSWCFANCDNLKTVPSKLFKNCKKAVYFDHCFAMCDMLENISSDIFEGCLNASSFGHCFSDCLRLKSILDGGLFTSCPNATSFSYCFYRCTSLEYIPSDMFKGCENAVSFSCCFGECSLISIPIGLFEDCKAAEDFDGCFSDTNITTIPEQLFKNSPYLSSIRDCFRNCTSLKQIPVSLFDNNRRIIYLDYAFANCNNLISESPYTVIDNVKYHLYERENAPDYFLRPTNVTYCFGGCPQLDDYNDIPDEWKQR